eukprot:1645324-Rhodomonas_salina.1
MCAGDERTDPRAKVKRRAVGHQIERSHTGRAIALVFDFKQQKPSSSNRQAGREDYCVDGKSTVNSH